jgi:CheY-like chemotaxis protein
VFIIRLPVANPDVQQQAPLEDQSSPQGPAPRRVLVVDDNVDAAASLAMMLKKMGNDVRTAHDGQSGIEVAQEFRPDAVLLDIGMPVLNGFDAARRIREQPWGKSMVLVALTGWGQDEDRRKSEEAGFDLHLVKPVEPGALQRLLAGVSKTLA